MASRCVRLIPLVTAGITMCLLTGSAVHGQTSGEAHAGGEAWHLESSPWAGTTTLPPCVVLSNPCTRDGVTQCICAANGTTHYTTDSSYPHTEDIEGLNQSVSAGSQVTLTTICPSLHGNLINNQTANVELRAFVEVKSATSPINSLFTLLLFIDGVQVDGTNRRLKATTVPYGERTYGMVQNLDTTKEHTFALVAKNLATSGSITFDFAYLTADGAPAASYPSVKDNNTGIISLTGTAIPVSDTVNFTLPNASDLALQGHLALLSQTANDAITVCFSLDGGTCKRTSTVLNFQGVYPEDFNFTDFLVNVPAGAHSIVIWAHTNGSTAQLQYRQVEAVSFPTTPGYPTFDGSPYEVDTPITVATNAGAPQPASLTTACGLNGTYYGNCGPYTKLLQFDLPAVSGTNNWELDSYVQMLGSLTGANTGDVSFEIQIPSGCNINYPTGGGTPCDYYGDGGYVSTFIPNAAGDGLYHFGDAVSLETSKPMTIRLWLRQRDTGTTGYACPHEPCSFQVGKRFATVRLVPFGADGCLNQ